jgi:hypothetical protein
LALLDVRDTYRFNTRESIKTDGGSFNSGQNPPNGAIINYFLPEGFKGEVIIEIEDLEKNLIRTLSPRSRAGVNRTTWDLRHEPIIRAKLLTQPPGRPWVQLNGEGWRPLVQWDLDLMAGQYGPRVAPGSYKVNLKIEDENGDLIQVVSKTFDVLKDPYSEGTQEDIEAQVYFSLQLRDAINVAVSNINAVEQLRKELENIIDEESDKRTQKEAMRLLGIAEDIAAKLYDIHLTGAREDAFRSPIKLYGRLSALASDINGSGIDFRPTNQQGEVYEVLNERLQKAVKQFDQIINEDIPKFNKALERKNRTIEIEKAGK